MGEVRVQILLENAADIGDPSLIRRFEMTALVDSGAVMLAIPQDVTERLGLRFSRKCIVSYADERREELDVVGPLTIAIGDRRMFDECLVLPPRAAPKP
jgi:aspartyl protease